MTALLTRIAPSPVPLAERSAPRDVTGNVWVQAPTSQELQRLFDGLEWHVAAAVPVHRRPRPQRHSG